jgi:hypothetical protein
VDDLEKILRASAPPVDVEACGAAARDVASAVAKDYRRRPRRLTRRAVVVTVGVLLIPAVAAASVLHFTAETGQYGKPGFTENDSSQYINMCASDINKYVAALEPTTSPLPPGVTWNQIGAQYVGNLGSSCPPQGPGQEAQVTGIKIDLLAMSSCPWEKWALSAPPSTATADLDRADKVLAETEVAEHQVNPAYNSNPGWEQISQQYAQASRAFLNYDYQVNCLGRNTAGNPPTVPDPNK